MPSTPCFLGIAYNKHDAAAALISNGYVIAAAQEERFNRVKYSGAFPKRSIDFCLRMAGIESRSLDGIGYFWQPWRGILGRTCIALRGIPHTLRLLGNAEDHRGNARVWINHLFAGHHFRNAFPIKAKFSYLEHHLCHAYSAFLLSPFDESAILTLDLSGESDTSISAIGRSVEIHKISTLRYPQSLGSFFGAITQYLGFETDSEESLVMGLASYGDPDFVDDMRRFITLLPKGEFRLSQRMFVHNLGTERWFSLLFEDHFGPRRKPGEQIMAKRFQDMASSAQSILEMLALHVAEELKIRTHSENLCLGGGVMLNAAMNQRFLSSGLFKRLYVGPAPNDCGTAIGAALIMERKSCPGAPRVSLDRPDLGPMYSDSEIESAIAICGLRHTRCDNPARAAAQSLAEGEIVGWFQGRMEFGPRALGHRSILADPSIAGIKGLINEKVKFRHEFRPFAASVKAESAREFFEIQNDSPFMMQICEVRPDKRCLLSGVTHVDGTCRPQTVTQESSPLFWNLLNEFELIRGIPVVLNTSFNVAGEPIVCSPKDAIQTFIRSGIDTLVIGSFVVKKLFNKVVNL